MDGIKDGLLLVVFKETHLRSVYDFSKNETTGLKLKWMRFWQYILLLERMKWKKKILYFRRHRTGEEK